MKVDRIRQLADHIESTDDVFGMDSWATCIYGHAARLFTRAGERSEPEVAAALGLTSSQGWALFKPDYDVGCFINLSHIQLKWRQITRAHAVAVLHHLADTGNIDWSIKAPLPASITSIQNLKPQALEMA